jgi:hypothetical protein
VTDRSVDSERQNIGAGVQGSGDRGADVPSLKPAFSLLLEEDFGLIGTSWMVSMGHWYSYRSSLIVMFS